MSTAEHYFFHSYALHQESLRPNRFLFNRAPHLLVQQKKNWCVYEMCGRQPHEVKARLVLHMNDVTAVSPLRASFGGVEVYRKVTAGQLEEFFTWIEVELKKNGVRKIRIKSYPEVYDAHAPLVEAALKHLHYSINSEITSVIPVDRRLFERKIKISERQKLRKARAMFSFERLPAKQLKQVYSFIENCRMERSQTLSMTYGELKKTMARFPREFSLYRVFNKNETVAAAVVIRINKEILYTFYYAHARKFDKVSPVVFLIDSLYALAQQQGVTLIDLGTSMKDGKIHRSLLHFKKSIGGESYRKLTFEKEL